MYVHIHSALDYYYFNYYYYFLANIVLAGELDRETDSTIVLTVLARDSISPFNTATTKLTVTVLDVNDNAPLFGQAVYRATVAEDLGVGGLVTTVLADDADSSTNAVVTYSIVTRADLFIVNGGTGAVTTIDQLDHETENLIEFVVKACDQGGVNMLCNNVTVIVTVTDINDVTPTFDYSTFSTDVCIDTFKGEVVLQIVAVDTDSGANGEVEYSVTSDISNLFTLDESNGMLSLAVDLSNSDAGSTVSFTVVATDNGDTPNSASADVSISICDKGVTPVEFNQSYYIGAIPENTAAPASVTTVYATATFSPITYHIAPSVVSLPFTIDPVTVSLTMFCDVL